MKFALFYFLVSSVYINITCLLNKQFLEDFADLLIISESCSVHIFIEFSYFVIKILLDKQCIIFFKTSNILLLYVKF